MLKTRQECIDFIHSAGRFGKKAGLLNIKALLDFMGNPQNGQKFVHVAGTNGKGSVVCMISNILISHGYKVGTNTSPYIESFNERLQINNVPISDEKLIHYTNLAADAVEKLNKKNCHPIEFEIITAIGFLYFKDEKCDFVVLECGLGGRFDATNAIAQSELSVISSIGLDHTNILGDTVEKIAFEKAGIIKPNGNVAVHPLMKKPAFDVIKTRASYLNAKFFETKDDIKILCTSLSGTDFSFKEKTYHLNLLGTYQVGNAVLAINCAHVLSSKYEICENDISKGILNSVWKCRFERIKSPFNCIIDGAHNYDGICEFVKNVSIYLKNTEKVFVIGMLNDKDFEKSASKIKELCGRIIITDVPSYRQTDGKKVFNAIKDEKNGAMYIDDYRKALKTAESLISDDGFICVAGSLYLAGAARTFINSINTKGI